MKSFIRKILILLALIAIVFVLINKQYLQQPKANLSENNEPADEIPDNSDILCYLGSYFNGSCLEALDINSDGVEELVYRPKGASWSQRLIILKEKMYGEEYFEQFCKNCTFSSQFHYAYITDLNGDKKMEVIVPADTIDPGNANGEIKYEFRVYYYENNDFVVKEKYDLPADNEERNKKIEELSINY